MKTTTVTCYTCGNTLSGTGWSRLWSRAAKLGWIKGKDAQKHYCCAKCLLAQFDYLIKDYSVKINPTGEYHAKITT